MRFFPKDWSWVEKMMIVLGAVFFVAFVALLFVGCCSSSYLALEVI